MSERFPSKDRPLPTRRGRPAKSININVIDYNQWHIEYSYYEIANEYLVYITPSCFLPQRPLGFTLSKEKIAKGQGVENYIISIVIKLEKIINKEKQMISRYFNIPLEEVILEQVIAFRELIKRKIF